MFGKRQRFERTDVPRDNPYRTQIAIAVLVLLALGMTFAVRISWQRAQDDTKLGDVKLVELAKAPHELSLKEGQMLPDGATLSQDPFTTAIFFQSARYVPGAGADEAGLISAHLLSVNDTSGASSLIELPLALHVANPDSGEETTLNELFTYKGHHAATAAVLQALGLDAQVIIVSPQNFLEIGKEIGTSGKLKLLQRASEHLRGARSNLRFSQLVDFAQRLVRLDKEKFIQLDVPLVADAPGSEVHADKDQLAVLLGRVILP